MSDPSRGQVLVGDALKALRKMPSESVHCIATTWRKSGVCMAERPRKRGPVTITELEALMRKRRMLIEYGGDTPAASAFRAAASAQDETWDEVAECYAPTLSEAIAGLVAQLDGK